MAITLGGRSYKVMVRVNSEDGWTANLLRFGTRDAAQVYGRGLAARWSQVADWRVDSSEDDVTERPPDAIEKSIPICQTCDAGDPTSVIAYGECDCETGQ